MASELNNLLTRRADIAEELAEMSSTAAGGKPNAAGKNVDHVGYRLSLYDEMDRIDKRVVILSGGATVEVIGRI